MDSFQNIGINGYVKRYGIKYGILRGLFLANPLHIISDYENKKILYYKKVKKKLEHRYLKYAGRDPENLSFGLCDDENPSWIYWKQGIDKAPQIVKCCIDSVFKHAKTPIILLDNRNVDNYVKLPSNIIKKNQKGIISDAALADLIRLSLLEHFGGTWIDATVFLSGAIPDYILKADFFAFRDTFGLIKNSALISNWFLHAKKHNEIIKIARNMSYSYFEKEKYPLEYLLVYIFLTIAFEQNKDKGINFPYANSDYSHQLFYALAQPYNQRIMEQIMQYTPIHKLSYKLTKETLQSSNSFYRRILNNEIPEDISNT